MTERDFHAELADPAGREVLLRAMREAARTDPHSLADAADRLIHAPRRRSPEALRHVSAGVDLTRAVRADATAERVVGHGG